MGVARGTKCRIVGTKWGGSFHVAMSALFLFQDDSGSWLGMPTGWSIERATRTLHIPYSRVFHVPKGRVSTTGEV